MRQTVELGQRHYTSHLKPLSGWPPVTALVDLLFLVLLSFCIAALYVRVTGIPVELPGVQPVAHENLERYVISIRYAPERRSGCILYFNDEPVNGDAWNVLLQKLSMHRDKVGKASVILSADRRIPSEVIAKVMSVSEKAGFATFWVVAEPDKSEKPILVK